MFEAIGFTISQMELWLLIFVRFLTMLSVLPFFSYDSIDTRYRVFLAILLATVIVKIVPYPEDFPVEFTMLMYYTAREVLVGLCIGMFSGFFIEIIKFAGTQASHMMGLNMAQMVDPTTSEESEVMPELFYMIAILLIISIDGHHFFLRMMFDTLFYIPITQVNFSDQIMPQMVSLASSIILLGIRISAPIVIIVFFVRIVVGIMNRIVQEADIFAVILIVNIFIGLYIMQHYWPYFAQMVNMIYNATQIQIMTIIRLMR
jgi:flagellar biosynthetic protein FliR